MSNINGYSLSRQWFDFAFENPEKIKPVHTAIYMFAVEHWNRLGQKKKFGFPSQMTMDAIGVRSYNTYIPAFRDLVDWGFFELIEKSKNQYSSNIIALSKIDKAPDKSLDKATIKAPDKSPAVYINHEQENHEQGNGSVGTSGKPDFPKSCEFLDEASKLAEMLLDYICNWDQDHRYNKKECPPKNWILEIERAMRIDGRTKEQLEWMIKFLFTSNHKIAQFWSTNVQSGDKLRAKFDKIKNQIKNSKQNVKNKEIRSTVDSLNFG